MTRKARVLILTFSVFLSISTSKAQVDELGNFMAAGVDDASKLFEAYLSPYINGFGASMTGGWYNTAKPHKLGGFDITFSLNGGFIGEDYRSFNVNELGLQTLRLADGEVEISPTIAGKDEEGPLMQYKISDEIPAQDAFNLVQGTGVSVAPSPMIQAGVGLFKGTEVIGRFMPKIERKGASVDMWGIGLKHSVKQWIPVLAKMPVLNLSVMGGYTVLNANAALEVTPETIGMSYDDLVIPETPNRFEDQSLDLQVKSFTANLLVSADLPVVCFYGGVGFASTNSELKLLGQYPIVVMNGAEIGVDASEKDPISFKVKNQDGGVTKPRLNAGIRFKFAVITLQFDYTYANYSVATAGLGISFR